MKHGWYGMVGESPGSSTVLFYEIIEEKEREEKENVEYDHLHATTTIQG